MKRMWFAGAVALLAATPAFAADLPQTEPLQKAPAYVPSPLYDWSGVYVGINGGYAFGNSSWGNSVNSGNFNVNGGVAGGTLGLNVQSGEFVYGLEGDMDWADIRGSSTTSATSVYCSAIFFPCTYKTSDDWLATARGRLGYAFNRVLVYGTGGAAFGDIKASESDITGADSSSNTEFGWTAGAGVEFAITDNITAKAEYLFVDLPNGSCSATACRAPAAVPVSFDTSLIRAGLNFKFNPF